MTVVTEDPSYSGPATEQRTGDEITLIFRFRPGSDDHHRIIRAGRDLNIGTNQGVAAAYINGPVNVNYGSMPDVPPPAPQEPQSEGGLEIRVLPGTHLRLRDITGDVTYVHSNGTRIEFNLETLGGGLTLKAT